MRFMLTFYADTAEWLSLPEAERDAAIAEIGRWFAEHAAAGKIVDGHRLAPGVKTVRLGHVGAHDRPVVDDGPLHRGRDGVGSYAIVEVADETEAVAIAERWPAGGSVEVRRLAE